MSRFCVARTLHLWVVLVGIVGLSVAGLTVGVVVPRVHHLKDF
jgi:hypothetical protein